MAFALTTTVITKTQVNLTWTDAASTVTVYRTAEAVSTPSEKDDWATDETIGTALSGASITDYSASNGCYYYATDGTSWSSAGPIDNTDYAEEIDPAYQSTNLSKVTLENAFIAQQNASQGAPINVLPLVADKDLAIVILQGDADDIAEDEIAKALKGKCDYFTVLQTGKTEDISGYTAKLSGTLKITYEADET